MSKGKRSGAGTKQVDEEDGDSFDPDLAGAIGTRKKTRTVHSVDDEIDPRLIEKERLGTLTSTELKELKRQRRVLKNRVAAQLFRKRQKDMVQQLEQQADAEERNNVALKDRIRLLKEENADLRRQLEELRGKLGPRGNN